MATLEVLLNAATVVFAERGFAGARVDEIAARAGVNKALIYAYYGDKKGPVSRRPRLARGRVCRSGGLRNRRQGSGPPPSPRGAHPALLPLQYSVMVLARERSGDQRTDDQFVDYVCRMLLPPLAGLDRRTA